MVVHARGMLPGRSELVENGINAAYRNATTEGGPRNGVLTALEDFAGERQERTELVTVPGWHGLAVLAGAGRLEASPQLGPAIARLQSPQFLREQLERIEAARIVGGMRGRSATPAAGDGQRSTMATRDYGLLDESE